MSTWQNTKSETIPPFHLIFGQSMQDIVINYDKDDQKYDLFVIGGGSGGVSCAKMASSISKDLRVGIADQVKPSTYGSTWGLGGTCVNVGCIPKKLMHHASMLGHDYSKMKNAGFSQDKPVHNWVKMVEYIQNQIKSINISTETALSKTTQQNKLAKFIDKHTLLLTDNNGNTELITSRFIVIAPGGRPIMNSFPGCNEQCITSDDIFSLKKSPGKTLCIGASYISLECASFLNGLGYDVTVMVRSILLRGFDDKAVDYIDAHMAKTGVKFIRGAVANKVEKLNNGKLIVYYYDPKDKNVEISEEYDTILVAIGRHADTKYLELNNSGVVVDDKNKIITNEFDQTCVDTIYSIGDCAQNRPELTPSSIQAGRLLAGRIFGLHKEKCDYINIPTTVFTSLEYGQVGYSEKLAREKFGFKVGTYEANFKPLEWEFDENSGSKSCYAKLVVNKSDNERIIGFHQVGPDAGEVTQGFSVAIKAGATKQTQDLTVGIHPTCAEVFTTMDNTISEGC